MEHFLSKNGSLTLKVPKKETRKGLTSVKFKNKCFDQAILAGDQWRPRTSGGRLHFEHTITHLLRHRFGHFVKGTKKITYKKINQNFCLAGKRQEILPIYPHANILAFPGNDNL